MMPVRLPWLRFRQVIRYEYCSCIIQGSGINNDTRTLEKHGPRRIYLLLLENIYDL